MCFVGTIKAMKSHWKNWLILFLILTAAAGWKAWLMIAEVVPFNSDEAIVALMARHILQGERPIFFYGQAYMGSLDAWLVAAGFALFGQNIWVIRLVQTILYIGTIITTFLVLKDWFGEKAGLIGAALLAIPPVNMTLYTTASLGGYGEALLLGNIILWLGWRIRNYLVKQEIPSAKKQAALLILFGLVAGLGIWANALTGIYILPVGLFLAVVMIQYRGWKFCAAGLGWILLGSAVGASPWIVFAVNHDLGLLIQEMFGSAVAVESSGYFSRVIQHLVNFVVLGVPAAIGMRPPWEVQWLALPLIPFVLVIWTGVMITAIRNIRKNTEARSVFSLIWGCLGLFVAGFLFTSFGVDPSGRYFLPAFFFLVLIAAYVFQEWVNRFRWGWIPLAVILVFQIWGNIQCANVNPPGLTTQFYEPARVDHREMDNLISFLKTEQEMRGYTNYWVSYPLAFQSQEELIFIPRLPYHPDFRYTERDDRYEPYEQLVNEADHVAYITTRNPALDDYLREKFLEMGLSWKERKIGEYLVFHQLSRSVRPDSIGLGQTTGP